MKKEFLLLYQHRHCQGLRLELQGPAECSELAIIESGLRTFWAMQGSEIPVDPHAIQVQQICRIQGAPIFLGLS